MIRIPYQRSITMMFLCALLLPNCQSQPRDTEEDASATALPQAVETVLSRDRNDLVDPSPGSPLPNCQSQPRDTEEDASATALPQAVDTVLSRDRNDLVDPSPGFPAPIPLGSGGAPLSEACSAQPHVAQPLDESGPSAGMQQVDILVPELAFGQEAWAQYFGEVREVPPLPKDITAILDGPCPFWEEQRVRDTHLLTLIPAKVGSQPFSLDLLGELIKKPENGGHRTVYESYSEDAKRQFGAIAPSSSYWVLMTHDVLPNSRSLTDTAQSSFATDHATRTRLPYALPTSLEAATTILMHHTRTGERLFTDNKKTWTRCRESVSDPDSPHIRRTTSIGFFGDRGLRILAIYSGSGINSCVIPSQGVAVCRKL
jgi:hypothetical protein